MLFLPLPRFAGQKELDLKGISWPDNDLTFFKTRDDLYPIAGLQADLDINALRSTITVDNNECSTACLTDGIRWEPQHTLLTCKLHNDTHFIACLILICEFAVQHYMEGVLVTWARPIR